MGMLVTSNIVNDTSGDCIVGRALNGETYICEIYDDVYYIALS